jgi:RimJ/RimL family protein N-acetyltransferase
VLLSPEVAHGQASRPPESIPLDGLRLRRPRPADAAAIAGAVADSLGDLAPWMPWANRRSAQAAFQRRRLEQEDGDWDDGVTFTYLILREGDSRLLGIVGLHRRVGPDALEVGYWLRTGETGKGIMTAAVRAVTGVALALPGVTRVELHCDQLNQRSAAVARRAGFTMQEVVSRPPEAPAESGRLQVWVTAGLPSAPVTGP